MTETQLKDTMTRTFNTMQKKPRKNKFFYFIFIWQYGIHIKDKKNPRYYGDFLKKNIVWKSYGRFKSMGELACDLHVERENP